MIPDMLLKDAAAIRLNALKLSLHTDTGTAPRTDPIEAVIVYGPPTLPRAENNPLLSMVPPPLAVHKKAGF